jgi:S-sulfo-L-cysteine synthase (O-acetyl-L-serine-dependent)
VAPVTTFRHGPRPLADVTAAIGNTPLVRIRHVGRDLPGIEIYAKLEGFNPGGSVKDRAALQIIRDAMDGGTLARGATLIDSTSGNTGIAYAWLGALLGIRVTLVMQASVSEARKQLTRAFGAEQIFSDPVDGSEGAIRMCAELVAADPGRYFYADQYSNESNPRAHFLGTGLEIWEQTRGRVTHFVAGIGTGGTIMGTGRRLKRMNPDIRVVAAEPAEPQHSFDGLKHMPTSTIPAIYKEAELDGKLSITSDDGWAASEQLGREEGLFVGHSSGAAFAAALQIARRMRDRDERGVIVTLFADLRERYFEAPQVIV